MYIEPCVRFAMRINPKMSEKPAASRNSRPPRAKLFNVWMIQYCTKKAGPVFPAPSSLSGLEVFCRWPVTRIHRVLQEFLRLIGPELADVRVSMNHPVHQPPILALDLADVDTSDHVSVFVERNGPPGGVDLDAAHRLHEGLLVLDFPFDGVQGRLQHRGFDVRSGRVETRVVGPVEAEIRGEFLVDRVFDFRRVPAG